MIFKNNRPKREVIPVSINNTTTNLNIYYEPRNSIRISITKKGVNLRLPMNLNPKEKQKQIKNAITWASEKLKNKKPRCIYPKSTTITTLFSQYTLNLLPKKRKTYALKFSPPDTLNIYYPEYEDTNNQEFNENIDLLIYKALSQLEIKYLEEHVKNINTTLFDDGIELRNLKLKPLHSKWGSMSKNNELVINTKLLFAPPEVLDYVIIHELVHTIEFNHSKKFWDIVDEKMPEYKKIKKWIKENTHNLNPLFTHQI